MARLKTNVYVADESGAMQAYGPDDDLSPDVAEKITNPDVWDDGEPLPDHISDQPTPGPGQTLADVAAAAAAGDGGELVKTHSRDDLDNLAEQWDVDPSDYRTKADLAAAIYAAGYTDEDEG